MLRCRLCILVFLLENLQKPNISVVKHRIFLRLQRCSRLLHRAPFNDATHLWYPHIGWNPVVREDGFWRKWWLFKTNSHLTDGFKMDKMILWIHLQITSVFFGRWFQHGWRCLNMFQHVWICINGCDNMFQPSANSSPGESIASAWVGKSSHGCGAIPWMERLESRLLWFFTSWIKSCLSCCRQKERTVMAHEASLRRVWKDFLESTNP